MVSLQLMVSTSQQMKVVYQWIIISAHLFFNFENNRTITRTFIILLQLNRTYMKITKTANWMKEVNPKKVSYVWISQSFRNLIIFMVKRGGCWCQPAKEQRRTQNEMVSQLIWKSLCELTLSITILSYFNNFHVQAKRLLEPPKSPKTKAAKNSERKGQSINLKIPLWIDTFHHNPFVF